MPRILIAGPASRLFATNGKEIPFTRAVLTVRNACTTALIDMVPHGHARPGGRKGPGRFSRALVPNYAFFSWREHPLGRIRPPAARSRRDRQQGPHVRIPSSTELKVRSCRVGGIPTFRRFPACSDIGITLGVALERAQSRHRCRGACDRRGEGPMLTNCRLYQLYFSF